ncbi:MAG: glutamine--fructose-6-phosphate transaminase (isomerizing) [Candidatus Omnitrophica bacterium]|nr:glutamine--fructose-6-phosphate transaminase (isomerizing) [Candidatus Omnitrophota bacterium]
MLKMCGIVGYIGDKPVVEALLDALGRLEYRGYDSAGVAVINGRGLEVRKRVGKIKMLEDDLRKHPIVGQVGVGHCLAGDTLIQFADGQVRRIDSFRGEATVLSLDPQTLQTVYRKAKVWSHPAPEELIEIQTPFGALACTPRHRMMTVDSNGALVAKAAGALKAGDWLLHPCAWAVQGRALRFESIQAPRYFRLGDEARQLLRVRVNRQGGVRTAASLAGISTAVVSHLWEPERNAAEMTLQPLIAGLGLPFPLPGMEPVDSRHGSFVHLPQQSSPELMQWLGYLLGDGHVGRRSVRFKDTDKDTLATYLQLTQHCFQLRGRVAPVPHTAAQMLEVNSLGLTEWLRVNVLSRRQEFLEQIGALGTDELAAFLRGLFDAEGGVSRQAGQIKLVMTDVELVRRIQLWLLRFGIVASLSRVEASVKHRRPRPALGVLMTRQDALTAFQDRIGFSAQRKRNWLQGVLLTKREGFYVRSRALLLSKKALFTWLIDRGVSRSALKRFDGGVYFTDKQAQRFFEFLEKLPQAAGLLGGLQRHLQAETRYQPILSVRRLPSHGATVYDLEVEGTENFFANGLLSHNSRWATHGEPSEINAHPHTDCTGTLAIVHNGIIENYAELKERLIKAGHTFRSKTDTEAVAHLIEEYAKKRPLGEAFREALKEVRGSYAICLVSSKEPEKIYGARSGSPLIVGVGKGEALFASDATAILGRTRNVIYLNDFEVVELTRSGPKLSTLQGKPVKRHPTTITWDLKAAQKGGYPHFMLKEIHEQPAAIEQTLMNRLDAKAGRIVFDRRTKQFLNALTPATRFVILGCGTAYHAGLVGEYMLEEFAHIPVVVDLASEFRYREPMLNRNTVVLAITQSGETADTLAGIRLAKEQGAKVLSICNVMGSSIARESSAVLYTHAGPEIAVASTKAYTSQVTTLVLLTLYLARQRKRIAPAQWKRMLESLAALPRTLEQALALENSIKAIAAKYAGARNFYYLGRRYNYPSALEGALKLKEICPLIHAEGYAAGEMKHGPISLIRKGWPVVFLTPQSPVYEKTISNIEEVRARKGDCIVVASEGDAHIKQYADSLMVIPKTEEFLSPIVAAVPLQLFAYYVADANGCDIDQPPNLAKSVTVE